MAQQVCVVLSAAEREQLAAIAGDRNRPRKHVERVRIVLTSADRHSVQQVAHSIGVSRPTVWRWQQRFAESGVELDRTQPGLPIKPGSCQTMTHDYKRHGTTTRFAALSVLDGTVIGRCMQRHRHSEFIRFLNAVEREVPAGKAIHAVLDNYATHKHPKA